MICIKNWSTYQSYKDRRPPWIRFHRTILDDYEYQSLSVESRALLPMLWLLACEDEDPKSGRIQVENKVIAFRLRQDLKTINKCVRELQDTDFIECIESVTKPLQDRNQTVPPETETETETELFDKWWGIYPKKVGKGVARKAFAVALRKASVEKLTASLEGCLRTEQWTKENGKFIPNPATWLNQERWDDEPETKQEKEEWI